MAKPHRTPLSDFEPTQNGRLQVVNYYDTFPSEDVATADHIERGVNFHGPFVGLTCEGHGKGIRVLVHQDMTAVEYERLLREILRRIEAVASREIENDLPW